MVGSVVRAPAEAVKSLVQSGATRSAVEAARRVLGTPEGQQNVFRAWSASICRDVPFGAIQLATFELVKAGVSSLCSVEAVVKLFSNNFFFNV